jgi:hypothetical protein
MGEIIWHESGRALVLNSSLRCAIYFQKRGSANGVLDEMPTLNIRATWLYF